MIDDAADSASIKEVSEVDSSPAVAGPLSAFKVLFVVLGAIALGFKRLSSAIFSASFSLSSILFALYSALSFCKSSLSFSFSSVFLPSLPNCLTF